MRLTGEPQVWPEEKSKKRREPMLVLFTAEKAMRFCVLISARRERRNRHFQTCQLPMTLCTPRPQSSNREYHTQMSIEFQLTVENFLEHRQVMGWVLLLTMIFFSSLAF